MEAVLKGAAEPVAPQQAAERAEFEAETAGSGEASVSILGKNVVMKMMKCEQTGEAGGFVIEAQEGPDRGPAEFDISVSCAE